MALRIGPRASLAVHQQQRACRHVLDAARGDECTVESPSRGSRVVDIVDDLRPVLVTIVSDLRNVDRHQDPLFHFAESRREVRRCVSTLYALNMASVRLFANLREIAGTSRVDLPASTVGEALDMASRRFGSEFERGLETSRVWVNGEEARPADSLSEMDEMVVLPPVSGGSQRTTMTVSYMAGASLFIAAVAVFANTQGQEIWAAALVAIAASWAIDLGMAFGMRGKAFAPLAVVTATAGGALTAHILGSSGYGLALAVAVVVVLGWGVAFPEYREVDVFAPTFLVSMLAALGAASLILGRSSFSPDQSAVDVFLVAMIAGLIVGSIVSRLPAMPFLDRFSTTAIATVLGAVGAASLWDLDAWSYLLIGLGLAVALVAGQGLSSMLRTGRVMLTEQPPGYLAAIDGVVLAAAIYYPLIRLVL